MQRLASRRIPGSRRPPAAVQPVLFEIAAQPERRYYRQIFDALARAGFGADPLASERVVSRLLGTVWASQTSRDGATEEGFGLSLVEYGRQRRIPTSVAALRTVAAVAPIRAVRESASRAADGLVADGLPEPAWSPPVGAVTPGRCWAFEDVFGDQTTVICEYGYGAEARHAIVVEVDHSRFCAATDVMLAEDVEALVRDLRNDAKHSEPMFSLRQAEPVWARAFLDRAFARTDVIGVEVEPTFAELRALAMARLLLLPENMAALPPDPLVDEPAVIDAFLTSPEGSGYSADLAALLLRYSQEYDPGAATRVSPGKWDAFAFDWLPRQSLPPEQLAALPDTVRAWSRWAGRWLPEPARAELAAAVEEIIPALLADDRGVGGG